MIIRENGILTRFKVFLSQFIKKTKTKLTPSKTNGFNVFNLDPLILDNVRALGYQIPTPIQIQSIPAIMLGQDVMGLAQTGTGKTAAFALPIIHRLMEHSGSGLRALVVAPTRELAQQINDAFKQLCQGTGLRSMALYGGVNLAAQIDKLKRGMDIVVACPGRLLDHVQQQTINLSTIQILVLDEADQMFDMGFLPSIRKLLDLLPRKRQSLLFSATMSFAIDELAYEALTNPLLIKIAHSTPANSVKQALFPVAHHLKSNLLINILKRINYDSVLIFTRTKRSAQYLATKLDRAGFRASSLQGNLSQYERQHTMQDFRDGVIPILIATDIASRGLDVSSISHVINYDMPNTVETYIHRIGRTGRADKVGKAYTLITEEDKAEVSNLEKVLCKKLDIYKIEDLDAAGVC